MYLILKLSHAMYIFTITVPSMKKSCAHLRIIFNKAETLITLSAHITKK